MEYQPLEPEGTLLIWLLLECTFGDDLDDVPILSCQIPVEN
jgi:hypothetical protein